MKENYCVYMHTLKIDGRKYIGITNRNPKIRWANGKGYHHNAYFTNAINKYGWNNFKHEILFENLSKEQACLKEQALIKLFHTTEHNFGFNMTSGGEHCEFSEEVLAKKRFKFDKELVIQLYITENKTQEEVSRILGCGSCTLWAYLKDQNITKPKREPITKEKLVALVDEGKTLEECGKILGYSSRTIWIYLKEFGIPKPNLRIKNIDKTEFWELYYNLCTQNNTHIEALTICGKKYNATLRTMQEYFKKYNLKKLRK